MDYLPPVPIPKMGTNPWAINAQADQSAATEGIQGGLQNISDLQSQAAPLMGAYPTFPNTYGIGSQSAFGGAQPPAQSPQQSLQINTGAQPPQSPTPPDTGSRGFNPWSLQGESNAR